MSHSRLAQGSCKCHSRAARPRRGCRQAGEEEFEYRKTVGLVLTDEKSGFLCRWSADTPNSIQSGDLLCYDEIVCISSLEDVGAILQKGLLPPSNTLKKARAWSLELTTDALPCQSEKRHSHATIGRKMHERKIFEMNNDYPRLLALDIAPINILSLLVEVESEDSKDSLPTAEPLLHAHWKRQLVGSIFLQAKSLNTSIRLKKGITLTVKSLTSRIRTATPIGPFIVLPSTRITIQMQIQVPRTLQSYPPNTSTVTKLLVDTIHCVANGILTTRTMLLSGPPGVGKTFCVKAALTHCFLDTRLVSLRGSELLQHQLNPARALEREFQVARKLASDAVVLLFMDEIEALVSVDSVAAMLATLLDQVEASNDKFVIVGATNRIESIPSILRRPGRFDREIPLSPPISAERFEILLNLFQETVGRPNKLDTRELIRIAELCVGYVPADLTALFRRAGYLALQDQSSGGIEIDQAPIVGYLKSAMDEVGASALRDASLSAPPTATWDDIAGDPGNAKVCVQITKKSCLPMILTTTVVSVDSAIWNRLLCAKQLSGLV